MATDKNTIKNWFKTGLKPTEAQFWATWDSYFHKDDKIGIGSVENLENILNNKANESHTHSQYATNDASSLTDNNIISWQKALKISDLKFDDKAITTTQDYSEFGLKAGATINEFNNIVYNKVKANVNENFANTDLEVLENRKHTGTASVDFGIPLIFSNPSQRFSSLQDKSNDATYTELLGSDSEGNIGKVGLTAMTKVMTKSSDKQKDDWRKSLLKSDENYSIGQPRIDIIYPPIIQRRDEVVSITAMGTNLFLNNTNTGTASVYLVNTSESSRIFIENIEVNQLNPSVISFRKNLKDLPYGDYHLEVTHNGLKNIDDTKFSLVEKMQNLPIPNLTWKSWLVQDNTSIPSDILSTGNNSLSFLKQLNMHNTKLKTYIAQSNKIKELSEGDFYIELNITLPFQFANVRGYRHSSTYLGLTNFSEEINTSNVYKAGLSVISGGAFGQVLSSQNMTLGQNVDPSGTLYIIKKGSNVNIGVLGKSINTVSVWNSGDVMLKFLIINDFATSPTTLNSLVFTKFIKL